VDQSEKSALKGKEKIDMLLGPKKCKKGSNFETMEDYQEILNSPDWQMQMIDQPLSMLTGTDNMGEHLPTPVSRCRVRMAVVAGINREDISKAMQVSEKTLNKHYKDELDGALADMNTLVTGKLVKQINEGNTTAMIFYLRTRARWTPKSEQIIEFRGTIQRTREEIENELRELGIPEDKFLELTNDG